MILALDTGSSGCRAALYNDEGKVHSLAERFYRTEFGADGGARQNPEDIYQALIASIGECLRNYYRSNPAPRATGVRAVVFGAVMHSLTLVDREAKPLTSLSIWSDRRAFAQALASRQEYESLGLHQKTGCLLSPAYPLYRLKWYSIYKPEIFAKFHLALSIKSFIIFRLFGLALEDYSVAAGSGLFDIVRKEWDDEILGSAGIEIERLPKVVSTKHQIPAEKIPDALRGFPGLSADTVWLMGASDGPLAHLGGVGRAEAMASLTIGTSGAVRLLTPTPSRETSDIECWSAILDENTYVQGLATNNGGNVLEWYMRAFFPELDDARRKEVFGRAVGASQFDPELIFLPFLFKERPVALNGLPSRLDGLRPRHSREDILRAVCEGLIFNLVFMLEKLEKKAPINRVFASGTVGRLPFSLELLGKLIGDKLDREEDRDNASLRGAWRLARETFTRTGVAPPTGETPAPRKPKLTLTPRPLDPDPLSKDGEVPAEVLREKYERWKRSVPPPSG